MGMSQKRGEIQADGPHFFLLLNFTHDETLWENTLSPFLMLPITQEYSPKAEKYLLLH